MIVGDEQLHTPHYEVTRIRENELGEETSRPSYQRGTPRKLATVALTKAQLNIPPAPAVTKVKPAQPAPLREPRQGNRHRGGTQGVHGRGQPGQRTVAGHVREQQRPQRQRGARPEPAQHLPQGQHGQHPALETGAGVRRGGARHRRRFAHDRIIADDAAAAPQ